MEIISYTTDELKEKVTIDQFSILGKCFQLYKAAKVLQDCATTAMGTFVDGEDHVRFLAAVGEGLNMATCIKRAVEEVEALLMWMRSEESEIFKTETDEES